MGRTGKILGCKLSFLALKYQGLPLGAHFKLRNMWDGVLERIQENESV